MVSSAVKRCLSICNSLSKLISEVLCFNNVRTKVIKYIALPYCNRKADEFATRLSSLVKNTFSKTELRVAFRAPNELGKMFPFKDNINEKGKLSNVVYQIECETCNQTYIGKTERTLQLRIAEHNTKQKGKENLKSAIQVHKKSFPDHQIDANNIKILDRADNNFKLMLKGMLHINIKKPELNVQHAAVYNANKNEEMFKMQLNTIIIARPA